VTACPIEDRLALEDLTIAFAHAVDSMHDLDGIAACFTENADYDLSGIGMASVVGRSGIRELYTGFFAANAHHAHYLSNFAVTAYGGDTASVRTYVVGMARGKDGSAMAVHVRYYFDAVRTGDGWQFSRYWPDFLVPPAG
jgi:ketosteroid isomerase-like protein